MILANHGLVYPKASEGGGSSSLTVVSLIHYEGANNSTTFTDSVNGTLSKVSTGNIIYNGALVDYNGTNTINPKIGSAFGQHQGASWIYTPTASTAFNLSGDFSLETYINFPSVQNIEPTCIALLTDTATSRNFQYATFTYVSGKKYIRFAFQPSGSNTIFYIQVFTGTTVTNSVSLTATGFSFNTFTWYHLAYTRVGNTFTVYINGVAVATASSTINLSISNPLFLNVGSIDGNSQSFRDEFRFCNGLSAYTGNFTPPTIPFSYS